MIIDDHNRLIVEDSDGLNFRFVPSPNLKPGGIRCQYLVIHGTEGQNVDGAIALVATLEPVLGQYLEGWVEKDSISLVGEERIVYPPLPVLRRARRREPS